MLKTVPLPRCKSLTIRQLILQYVYTGEVMDVSEEEPSDVLVTHRALEILRRGAAPDGTAVDVADCGAAGRFLLALLAVTPGRWLLTGTPRLLQRPMEELVQALLSIGADIHRVPEGWHIVGKPLRAKTLTIDCTRSSQFASALLLISPMIGLEELYIQPLAAGSLPYVRMTLACLIQKVKVPAISDVPETLGLPGDWSAALFWYAMALLHPEYECELSGISLPSVQGDAVVAEWFFELGVTTVPTDGGVRIAANAARQPGPFRFNVSGHPDVVPVMAALACLLPADFTFLHTHNLGYKESDRVGELAEQLAPFAEIERTEDSLRVVGKARARWPEPPFQFRTCSDHRLAMAFLLFGTEAHLDDLGCLRKSYPKLADILQSDI